MIAPRKTLYSTPAHVVENALALAKVSSKDILLDIGCGDGRCLIQAAQSIEVRGIGVEIVEERAAEAKKCVGEAGLSDMVTILAGNILDHKLDDFGVTVVFMFVTSRGLRILRPLLEGSSSPIRVVSYLYRFEGLEPDATCYCTAPGSTTHEKFPLYLYLFGGGRQ